MTLSHGGYMKAQPVAEYRAQRRGGRGKQATGTKEDDFIDHLFIANTHDHILCFSNRGRVYWLKVYNVPQGGRISRGKPIVNLVPLLEHEKITAILPVKEFVDDRFVFMATAHGTVKKTPLSEFSRPRPSGIIAVDLDDGDAHFYGTTHGLDHWPGAAQPRRVPAAGDRRTRDDLPVPPNWSCGSSAPPPAECAPRSGPLSPTASTM